MSQLQDRRRSAKRKRDSAQPQEIDRRYSKRSLDQAAAHGLPGPGHKSCQPESNHDEALRLKRRAERQRSHQGNDGCEREAPSHPLQIPRQQAQREKHTAEKKYRKNEQV